MDTTAAHFIERANRLGILLVRSRNPDEDLTGWGALEFVLNNGEIFVVSGEPFGQGHGEDGLWVDMNALKPAGLRRVRHKAARLRETQEDDTVSSWVKHNVSRG